MDTPHTKRLRLLVCLLCLGLIAACSSPDNGTEDAAADPDGLTQAQLENGIGPIESLSLGAIDEDLASRGATSYNMKCSACHKFDERYVGPPLGDLLERRTPEFVMNMMLNPGEMVEKHPEVKAMLAVYLTPMPNQNLSQDEARAILEYFRQHAAAANS